MKFTSHTFLMYTAHVHFFTNLDLFCIDNARVIYRKIRYIYTARRKT